MPSLEPTPTAGKRRPAEPDPVATQIQERLTQLREAAVNPEDAVEQGLLAILETTEIAAGAICLYDARQQVLRLAAERGLSDQGCKSLRNIRRGYGGAWDMPLQSLSNRRVYLIENAAQNRYVPPLIDDPEQMRTVLCVPLLTGTTPVGSLILVSTARKAFADQEVARLEGPGRDLAVIIEAARARARQTERTPPSAPMPEQPYRGNRATSDSVIDHMVGQRYDADQEVARAREVAAQWERKHQELAGELAAATAREQRLRDELTSAAERLQDLSVAPRAKGSKDEAAQLAQNARLQASLAEAEAIAARERMRASEVDRKLAEMAELLSASAAREEELRRTLQSGDDGARQTELIDQSLELARVNARLAEAETALAAARAGSGDGPASARLSTELAAALAEVATTKDLLERTTAEFEARLQGQQAAADTERGRLEAKIADLDMTVAETRLAAQTADGERQALASELAAVRAREDALQTELRAAADHRQRLEAEAEERERQREQARSGELAQLQAELREATESAQRASERLGVVEQRHQEVAGQLAATSTREQALREELDNTARNQQARTDELEALLEHERTLVLDWQEKYQALDAEHRTVVERERERLADAIRDQEEAAAQAAAAQDAMLGMELAQLRERLAAVEAGAARDAVRATEWEQRCGALSAQLDEVVTRNAVIDRELQQSRGQLTTRSADAAAAAAEKAVETETLAARVAEAEAARAAAEQTATGWAQRHDALAAELEASVGRAEELARALEAIRADNATDRVEAEGARAAAQAEAEATRTALADAQQRADTLGRELDELRTAKAGLETKVAALEQERASAAAQRPAPTPAPTPATPARPSPPPTAVRPATIAAPVAVKSEVQRIVVIDDPSGWTNAKLHGVETIVLAPGEELPAQLAEASPDRVLLNLAARGIFDAAIAARAAGVLAPFCGCVIAPGAPRGLALGLIEVARTPLDPDEVTTMLAPFTGRGTRVLTAGADADAFISLRQALSRLGMSVSMAWDGKQASDLLPMVRPEVVVIDLDTPPRGGLPVLLELSAGQSIPMLVLLPGRQDLARRVVTELADPTVASRLLPPERLLDEVRRSSGGKAKS